MKRRPFNFVKRRLHHSVSMCLVTLFLFNAAAFVNAQDDDEEFVQAGIVSSTDDPKPDPFRLFNEAQDAHEKGELDKALELYTAALLELPEFPEAEYQRAVIYNGRGLLQKAETSFRRAVELKPDWTLALAGLGSVLLSKGDFDEAESVLVRALELDSMSYPAYISLTNVYLTRPTPEQKIRSLHSKLVYVTSKSSIPAELWVSRAGLERALGNFEEARRSIRRSKEIQPANRFAAYEEAELAIAVLDYEGAIGIADALLKRYPESEGAKILLARGYALKGESEKALRILGAIEADNQQAADLADDIRVSVLEMDIPALEAALAENPSDVALLGKLCSAYRRGDAQKAVDYCRQAYELEPGNLSHAIGFGAALVQLRQFNLAIIVLEKLKKIDGENHTVRANLATAYFLYGNFEKAKAEYLWIVEKQPQLPAGYYFLAITHDRLSEYVDAMANYQQFLRIAEPAEFEDEIGRVRLRLVTLQKQIDKGKKR